MADNKVGGDIAGEVTPIDTSTPGEQGGTGGAASRSATETGKQAEDVKHDEVIENSDGSYSVLLVDGTEREATGEEVAAFQAEQDEHDGEFDDHGELAPAPQDRGGATGGDAYTDPNIGGALGTREGENQGGDGVTGRSNDGATGQSNDGATGDTNNGTANTDEGNVSAADLHSNVRPVATGVRPGVARFPASHNMVADADKFRAAANEVLAKFSRTGKAISEGTNIHDDLGILRGEVGALKDALNERFGTTLTIGEAQNFLMVRDVHNAMMRKVSVAAAA